MCQNCNCSKFQNRDLHQQEEKSGPLILVSVAGAHNSLEELTHFKDNIVHFVCTFPVRSTLKTFSVFYIVSEKEEELFNK